MPRGTRIRLAPGIYQDAHGLSAVVAIGSGTTCIQREKRFAPGTPLAKLTEWQAQMRRTLRAGQAVPLVTGDRRSMTLAHAVVLYLQTVTSMPSFPARRADCEAWLPRYGQRSIESLGTIEIRGQIDEWATGVDRRWAGQYETGDVVRYTRGSPEHALEAARRARDRR